MVRTAAHTVKKKIDHLKFNFKKKFNLLDPVIIYPYMSYGYNGKIILKGRVLEKESVFHGEKDGNSILNNIWRIFKRYESDEIPYARLQIKFKEKLIETKTDDEGFYEKIIHYNTEKLNFWEKASFTLLNNPAEPGKKITAEGEIMIPPQDCDFGIISDVDDTIIQSHALHPIIKLKTLVMNTAENRIAFPGVAGFYKALTHGLENKDKNPLWFISGSSWNLYDLLTEFCKVKNIPKAPLALRKLGITKDKWVKNSTEEYKMEEIRPVMDLMDPLPFILIGDSGQKDPEIYKKVVEEYPGRIKAIYIRDVTTQKRDEEVMKIRDELKEKGVDMILASNSLEAARHASEQNWIPEKYLEEIRNQVNEETKKK